MAGEHDTRTHSSALPADTYDPFARGPFPVGVRTLELSDPARNRLFPCEIWYPAAAEYAGQDFDPATQDVFGDSPAAAGPAPRRQHATRNAAPQPGTFPLVAFSHSSGGDRRQSTFLCTHLGSHGYVVAALDHSDRVALEFQRAEGETAEQRTARVAAWIANRVPDIRFLLDTLLSADSDAWEWVRDTAVTLDPTQVGIVGHSFGGWTALAAPEQDQRIRAVVALAPGGSSQPPPAIIPATLTFEWGRDVSTLYLVAADDSFLPLSGMYELYDRTQATRRMFVLSGADHGHFADEFEQQPGQCSPERAHTCIRGLTLAHLDAVLKRLEAARHFWRSDVAAVLAARGIEAAEWRPSKTRDEP